MECDSRHFKPVRPTHRCVQCHKTWCTACLVTPEDNQRVKMCPDCRDLASPLPADRGTFFSELPTTLRYPMEGSGVFIVVGGTILLAVLDFIASLSFLGIIAAWISLGYMLAYYARVVESSANGDVELPDWPELHWNDLSTPVGHAAVVLLISFLPAVAAFFAGLTSLAAPLAIAGVAYAPMAWLSVALHQSVLAVNPVTVLSGIARVPVQYVVAVAAIGLTMGVSGFLEYGLGESIVGSLGAYAVGLYGTLVSMRILGLLYLHNEQELDWFGESAARL